MIKFWLDSCTCYLRGEIERVLRAIE